MLLFLHLDLWVFVGGGAALISYFLEELVFLDLETHNKYGAGGQGWSLPLVFFWRPRLRLGPDDQGFALSSETLQTFFG